MSITVISDKKVKANTEHKCNYCGGIIKKGEIYSIQKNVYDNKWCSFKCHTSCENLVNKLGLLKDCEEEEVIEDFFEDAVVEVYNNYVGITKHIPHNEDKITFLEKLEIIKNINNK